MTYLSYLLATASFSIGGSQTRQTRYPEPSQQPPELALRYAEAPRGCPYVAPGDPQSLSHRRALCGLHTALERDSDLERGIHT